VRDALMGGAQKLYLSVEIFLERWRSRVERRRWKDGTLLLEVHLTQVGRPDRSGGRAAALGRRAAPRAATLKLRAARMWPPLGLWATHGGRGGVPVWQQGGRRRIGRIGRIERFDALNALRTIAFEGSSPRARKRAAKAYCGTERQASSHGRGGGGTRVPPGRCVRQHALRQQRRPPVWQTRSSEPERCAV
jgi:hypothetical protein